MKRWAWWAWLPLAVAVAVVLIVVGFLVWALTPYGPDEAAAAALVSDEYVSVEETEDGWVVFTPEGDVPRVGLVLYPGGRVDPRAYAPLAREVADRGYLVVVPPMTLNLAVLSPDRADEVIAAYPEIDSWAMAGHSLGGSMAARYTLENTGTIGALTLLASYPGSADDLSDIDIDAVSAYGTRDGILDPDTFTESVDLLPHDAAFVEIEGGNHAQFGSYGPQAGDAGATISAEDQQWEAADAIGLAMRPLRIRTH